MAYYSRASWGASPARSVQGWSSGKPDSVTVHAVGAALGQRSDYRSTVKGIQIHAFSKGLSDIDYNFLVDLWGNVYEGRGWAFRSGAQHVGNASSIAVCYLDLGDGDVPFTDAAKAAILGLAQGKPVHPHRYWNQFTTKYVTSCPGNEISAWCDAPHATPPPPPKPPAKAGKEVFRIIKGDKFEDRWLTNWLERRHIGTTPGFDAAAKAERDAIIKAGVTDGAGEIVWPQAYVNNIPEVNR